MEIPDAPLLVTSLSLLFPPIRFTHFLHVKATEIFSGIPPWHLHTAVLQLLVSVVGTTENRHEVGIVIAEFVQVDDHFGPANRWLDGLDSFLVHASDCRAMPSENKDFGRSPHISGENSLFFIENQALKPQEKLVSPNYPIYNVCTGQGCAEGRARTHTRWSRI